MLCVTILFIPRGMVGFKGRSTRIYFFHLCMYYFFCKGLL